MPALSLFLFALAVSSSVSYQLMYELREVREMDTGKAINDNVLNRVAGGVIGGPDGPTVGIFFQPDEINLDRTDRVQNRSVENCSEETGIRRE